LGFHFRRQSPVAQHIVNFERGRRLIVETMACRPGSMDITDAVPPKTGPRKNRVIAGFASATRKSIKTPTAF
jgi:hypothetical protein